MVLVIDLVYFLCYSSGNLGYKNPDINEHVVVDLASHDDPDNPQLATETYTESQVKILMPNNQVSL